MRSPEQNPPIENPEENQPEVESNLENAHWLVRVSEALNVDTRYALTVTDPKIREAAGAAYRTIMNVGITAADVFPGIGEAVSWSADAGKIIHPLAKRITGVSTDLTPDVPKKIAIGSEALELAGLGIPPTHIIETGMQLPHDIERMGAGLNRLKEIWRGEAEEYQTNQREVAEAMEAFGVQPPELEKLGNE